MAGLGWIHFSNSTRKKVLEVIDLLGEKGAVDELGIGVVRNAFSNEMFAGVSTIMTRARYFYIVPYLIIDYLRKKQKYPIDVYMDKAETDIMMQLTNKHMSSAEKEKIIGYTIAKRNLETNSKNELVRKPSEIYWGGIRVFQLFKKQHSFAQLSEVINQGKYRINFKDNEGTDKESGDDASDHGGWLDIFDVPYTKDWQRDRITLTVTEAEHLKHNISNSNSTSLLTEILNNASSIPEFLSVKEFHELIDTELFKKISPHNQKVVRSAVQFWNIMVGAHIRLNVMIQQREQQAEEFSFDEVWNGYLHTMSEFDWSNFDENFMWRLTDQHSYINYRTRLFIKAWISGIKNDLSLEDLDRLVKQQEEQNKKERSKFKPDNQESYNGWIGIQRLDYRLNNVKTIVSDINSALTATEHA